MEKSGYTCFLWRAFQTEKSCRYRQGNVRENGAERVAKYSVPMAAGLCYNYAAKEVDETVLAALEKLANEAELSEKFEELYNGAVINTGENRMVLHHLARVQAQRPQRPEEGDWVGC